MDAPPELWDRIAQAIATDLEAGAPVATADLDNEDDLAARRARRTSARWMAPAAAFDRAATSPGAREVGLQSRSGATLARVVLLPDGAGYLRADLLEPLPPNQTYQLWAVTGSATKPTVVSAGVLGPDPSALGFHASGPVRAFAVTVENTGGVVTSRNKPIAPGAVA